MLVKSSWWRPLRGDPMGWLLDYDNPAVTLLEEGSTT